MAARRYIAKDEKQKQDARIAEMQAEACNWPQAVRLRLTALGMPPLSRVGAAGTHAMLLCVTMHVRLEKAGQTGRLLVRMPLFFHSMSDTIRPDDQVAGRCPCICLCNACST